MRVMMRNTDRELSNIESSPKGFNMLRHVYETVQETFLNATTLAGATGKGGADPFAALLGTQGGNQVRDGSTNQSSPASGITPDAPAPNKNPLPNPWSSSSGYPLLLSCNFLLISNHSSKCFIFEAVIWGFSSVDLLSEDGGGSSPQASAGLGGLSLPSFEGLFGAMQDTNSLNQLMQNPAISQMMQSLLSNPQYMNQVLGLSPQVQSLVGSNSQLREVMQNSQFLRQLTSPEMMQQSLLSLLGRSQPSECMIVSF
ncbi:hypothetical protein V6N13_044164 [Hibiscus sabdariffa]